MTKPRKPSEKLQASSKLLEALKFLSAITKDTGKPNETHIYIKDGAATAHTETLSAGVLIDEQLFACPHNATFLSALSKCGQEFSITQLENDRLSIKSGKFKAIVPCLAPSFLFQATPDNPRADIGPSFRDALAKIESIKAEEERLAVSSFLMNGASVIATNGKIIFEAWHGLDLPPGLAVPKAIIPAITGNSKRLMKFGFSNNSVTFYFEDWSWIKSQLYAGEWPRIDHLLDKPANFQPIPSDFFTALDAVGSFSENGTVYFDNGFLRSHQVEGKGASYEVAGLVQGPRYAAKYLAQIKPFAKKVDFNVQLDHGHLLIFYGDNIRGVVAGYG